MRERELDEEEMSGEGGENKGGTGRVVANFCDDTSGSYAVHKRISLTKEGEGGKQ